jgi:hypothetical protein
VCMCACARVRLRACLRRTWSWGAATWLPSQSAAHTCTHMHAVSECLCVHTRGGQHRAGYIAEQKRGTAMCELVVAAGVKFEVLRLVRPRVTHHPPHATTCMQHCIACSLQHSDLCARRWRQGRALKQHALCFECLGEPRSVNGVDTHPVCMNDCLRWFVGCLS